MNVEEFNFYLPEELIAQHPLEKRDTSRLMVLDKKTGEIEHKLIKQDEKNHIWSDEQSHEAIISKEIFDKVQDIFG